MRQIGTTGRLRMTGMRDLPVGQSYSVIEAATVYLVAMATMKSAQAAVEATVRTWFQSVQSLR